MSNYEEVQVFKSAATSRKTQAVTYVGLLAAAVVAVLSITTFGEALYVPHATSVVVQHATPSAEASLHLLVALMALLVASSLLTVLCRWIHQPPVIGEILAGVCLGPSLLGRVAPSMQHYLIPPSVTPQLATLAQMGVILFMFLVGLELDSSVLRSHTRSTAAISHASIALPFVLGTVAAIWLYPSLGTTSASFTAFALFFGVSLSVTAFPVLARILTDTGMNRSSMGIVALTCAAIDDVTAWCLLAIVVGIAKASARDAIVTCVSTLLYIVAVLSLAQPAIGKWVRAQENAVLFPRKAVIGALLALLLSCFITERIGIHAVFGAFLLGAIIPHDSVVARALRSRFHDIVVVLFMPAFYVLTGLRTRLDLVDGWGQWLVCLSIILIACAGKFGGSYLAARIVGLRAKHAASIGILMNTRGLMELIVLDLGYDLGIISPRLFAMMVVMAVVTTFITSPLLQSVHRHEMQFSTPAEPVATEADIHESSADVGYGRRAHQDALG